MTTTFYMARHAAPSEPGVCCGQSIVEVDVDAFEAANLLKDSLVVRPREVWSSPWARCSGPAQYLAHAFGVPHRIWPELSELSYGRWEGQRWIDIHHDEPELLRQWSEDWVNRAPPGGETAGELLDRVKRVWDQRPVGDVAVIGHAGSLSALQVLAGESWDDVLALPGSHLEWSSVQVGSLR